MNIELVCFTRAGYELANRMADLLENEGDRAGVTPCFGDLHIDLKSWTEECFASADALIFVGAAGIAVRAVSPYMRQKLTDPAVLCADEAGRYLIPLLAGHVGGANELAARLAPLYGAAPIITTATDLRGLWAVDVWAKNNGCAIINPGRIKTVSGKLLESSRVLLYSDYPIAGSLPDGVKLTDDRQEADAVISSACSPWTLSSPLLICPKAFVLGVGCKKGTDAEQLRLAARAFLEPLRIPFAGIAAVASIDLKQQEEGLLLFAQGLKAQTRFFTAEELMAVEGSFEASPFVEKITGADNVCERAAAALCGSEHIVLHKTAYDGITLALGAMPVHLNF